MQVDSGHQIRLMTLFSSAQASDKFHYLFIITVLKHLCT